MHITCVYAYGGQRSTQMPFFRCCSLWLMSWLLTGTWNPPSRLGRVAIEPEESTCFCFLRTGIICAHTSMPGFYMWVLGIDFRFSRSRAGPPLTAVSPDTSISVPADLCSSGEENPNWTVSWYWGSHRLAVSPVQLRSPTFWACLEDASIQIKLFCGRWVLLLLKIVSHCVA